MSDKILLRNQGEFKHDDPVSVALALPTFTGYEDSSNKDSPDDLRVPRFLNPLFQRSQNLEDWEKHIFTNADRTTANRSRNLALKAFTNPYTEDLSKRYSDFLEMMKSAMEWEMLNNSSNNDSTILDRENLQFQHWSSKNDGN